MFMKFTCIAVLSRSAATFISMELECVANGGLSKREWVYV